MKTLIAMAAVLTLAGAANAGNILYSNGAGPNYNSANDMTVWAQAEDFTGVTGLVTDVHYNIVGAGLPDWDGTIQWAIYLGDPNSNILVGSGDAVNIETSFDQKVNGFDFYNVNFDLDNPVNVDSANTYWLALHMNQDFDSSGLFWSTQDANGTTAGLESHFDFDGPWNTNDAEHWFELTTTVPVPGALALLGLAGVAGVHRRRRE